MAGDGEGGEPNPTLYVQNIKERIRGEKLRRGLKQVFSPYGAIKKIHMRRSLALRGQAFVVFASTEAATTALEKAQGFNFYGQPLRVAFAHTPSDITLVKQGEEAPKRPAHPRKGLVAVKLEKAAKPTPAPAAVAVAQPYIPAAGPIPVYPPPHANGAAGAAAPPPPPPLPGVAPPNKTLLLEALPQEATSEMLTTLFKQYAGFSGVRIIPGRACAFVDFGTDADATTAMQGLKGFKLAAEYEPLKLSYAR